MTHAHISLGILDYRCLVRAHGKAVHGLLPPPGSPDSSRTCLARYHAPFVDAAFLVGAHLPFLHAPPSRYYTRRCLFPFTPTGYRFYNAIPHPVPQAPAAHLPPAGCDEHPDIPLCLISGTRAVCGTPRHTRGARAYLITLYTPFTTHLRPPPATPHCTPSRGACSWLDPPHLSAPAPRPRVPNHTFLICHSLEPSILPSTCTMRSGTSLSHTPFTHPFALFLRAVRTFLPVPLRPVYYMVPGGGHIPPSVFAQFSAPDHNGAGH